MTTVVNNPAPVSSTDGNSSMVMAVVLIGLIAFVLYFSIPAIQHMGPVQLKMPTPQINIPDKVNVNVQQTK